MTMILHTDDTLFDKQREIDLAKYASKVKKLKIYKAYLKYYPNGHYAKDIKKAVKKRKRITSLKLSALVLIILISSAFVWYKFFFSTISEIIWIGQYNGIYEDSRDGQKYDIIKIGDQIWMAENLNFSTEKGSWCYENDEKNCDIYGKLYNWDAATEAAPYGWHIPSDEEWKELENYLGLGFDSINYRGWRGEGNKVGKKLKSDDYWSEPNTGAFNTVGFSALPAGYCFNKNDLFKHSSDKTEFDRIHLYAYFWSSDDSKTDAISRALYKSKNSIYRNYEDKSVGLSVRCIKDK